MLQWSFICVFSFCYVFKKFANLGDARILLVYFASLIQIYSYGISHETNEFIALLNWDIYVLLCCAYSYAPQMFSSVVFVCHLTNLHSIILLLDLQCIGVSVLVSCFTFLPARCYASIATCPSVTRRRKLAAWFLHHLISPRLVFWRQISSPNSKGFPPNGGLKQGSVGKIQRFFSFKCQYLENRSRYGQSYY